MKIPLGDFGNAVAKAAPVVDQSAVFGTAAAEFDQLQRTRDAVVYRQTQERQQLQRAKAHNAALTYQLDVEGAAQATAADIESGVLDYNLADTELQKRVATIKRPQVELEDPVDVENFDYVLNEQANRANKALVPVVRMARAR